MQYEEFLQSKRFINQSSGFNLPLDKINNRLFEFQKDIVHWCLKKGKSAIFADCGLGKTPMQLEWANQVHQYTKSPILILAPLAVSFQTKKEALKFNIDVKICEFQQDVVNGINITNYEKLEHFNCSKFSAVVLDESSILKSYSGAIKQYIVESFQNTPFKLACTATPSPNDHTELGNHSEFLNQMSRAEMLATFFVHDGGDTSKWRLKGHAQDKFWEWVASWSVNISKPSNLGYSDNEFILPELNIFKEILPVDLSINSGDELFRIPEMNATSFHSEKRLTLQDRVNKTLEIVKQNSSDQFMIWCDTNYESEALKKAIPESIEVKGRDSSLFKEQSAIGFQQGNIRILISKPSIFGFGLNFQNCHNVIFCGLSYSYENYYQAIRRFWRFGQTKPVNCWIVIGETENNILNVILEKEKKYQESKEKTLKNILSFQHIKIIEDSIMDKYQTKEVKTDKYTLILGDCIQEIKKIESDSIHFSIFSPPFSDLYTYSNSEYDIGNCKSYDQFWNHFEFLIPELYRILKPGRLVAFHCMNLPISKEREGYIGIRDFRGELIRLFQKYNFIFHSEVCIWKDPVIAMQRTKALGLLHKQLKKDSSMSRQGIPDYLIIMRKHGHNPEAISHNSDDFPVWLWQQYASPVWDDINPSDTLQRESAREDKDEKHICPLQLTVIQRAIELWTNPNDIIFTPFMGIGSECYQALKMDRRAIGIELKESYFNQAVLNCKKIIDEKNQELLIAI